MRHTIWLEAIRSHAKLRPPTQRPDLGKAGHLDCAPFLPAAPCPPERRRAAEALQLHIAGAGRRSSPHH